MNDLAKSVKNVMTVFLVLFIALISYIAYFQLIKSPKINEMASNTRVIAKKNEVLRGTIYDRNETALTTSERLNETSQKRNYLYDGLYVHALGYTSAVYGKTGLEEEYDSELTTYNAIGNNFRKFLDSIDIKGLIEDIKNDKESELHIQREDEIGVLSSSLIEMKEEIDRQNEIKEEMIHNISHDLKTPIALIQTYAQSIKDDIYPYGDKDSSVDVILENTDRLEKKVKSLLYLNRLDYISGQIGDETCSMKELIEHIVFQLTAMHTQIEILTDLQDSSFKGKDDYWRICIENIIENAARYVHHEIKIILKDQYLEIFNDGEPIDNSNPESLFQPYEIGHKGQFGLGLSIVYKTVTMYGYKVEAVNRVDGVSFIIQKKD